MNDIDVLSAMCQPGGLQVCGQTRECNTGSRDEYCQLLFNSRALYGSMNIVTGMLYKVGVSREFVYLIVSCYARKLGLPYMPS